ncbi:hypothetical protein N7523_000744 [Penicillium sp. IBT 18751x]|nr:hypothetical protein N7523_000744 [Penicillium sp. IBT 18751x]
MAKLDKKQQAIMAASTQFVDVKPRSSCQRGLLRVLIDNHLNWRSRKLSPMISTSERKSWTMNEAKRRRRDGDTRVVVYEILITAEGLKEYRKRKNPYFCWKSVAKWRDSTGLNIPGDDFAGTEFETLFLHRIPEEFIVNRFWV